MDSTVTFVLVIIGVALVFDFINGFHDSANSIATVVSTRVLSPSVAVLWAAFFNFIAAFTVGTAVAKTIGKGLIDPAVVDPTVSSRAMSMPMIGDRKMKRMGLIHPPTIREPSPAFAMAAPP